MSQQDMREMKTSPSVRADQVSAAQADVQDMKASGTAHRMSIALTIGVTIGVIGLIIFLYGLFGPADFSRSAGINIDLWWGLLMVVFGIIMSVGGYISAHRHITH